MAASEKVGIEIELMNADTALRTLQRIDETVRNLGRKKTMIKLDDGSIDSIDNQIKKIQDRLDALRAAKKIGVITPEETEEAKRLEAQLRLIKRGLKDGTAEARTFKQEFNSISSKVAHIGSALQSFGNAMTTLTSPFRRITDGILMGTGYKLLNSFTEGFEKGFTRYDTMKKYPKIMAAFGYSADEAQKSIDALDLSVRGLPTGLDEMVDLAQRFTATTGDIQKGTDLAIATNRAFLASMSTDAQRYQGMMQLQDVLGGKDMNAREWNSLVSSMTPAIVKMGESLGYTSKNMDEWIQKVRDGKVSNEDFIDTLIKIGGNGGVLQKMADESKDTWQAFFANVGNASSRMLAHVVEALDTVSQSVVGKDVNQLFADTFIPAIDRASESIQKWIKAHPEEITDFFKSLANIDWGSLVKGYVKGMGLMAKATEGFLKLFGDKGLGRVGMFLGAGGGIGKFSTIIGGLLKGTRHLWALLGVGGKWIGGKLGKVGIFEKIASIFGSKKGIADAGKVAKTIPSVSDTFKSALNSLSGLIQVAGAVLITSGTAFVVTEATKRGIANFKEALNLLKDIEWSDAKKLLLGIGGFLGGSAIVGGVVGKFGVKAGTFAIIGETIVGLLTSIASGFFAADMALIKTGLKNFSEAVGYVHDAVSGIKELQGLGDISKIADKVERIRRQMWEIKDAFEGKQGDKMDRGVVQKGMPTFSKGTADSMKNFKDAVTYIKDSITGLNELATLGININITSKIEQMKRALSSVAKALNGGDGEKPIPIIGEDKVSSMKNMADAVTHLHTLVDNLNSLATIGINQNILIKLQQIKRAIHQVETTFPNMLNGISGPANLSKNANAMADGIRGLRRVVWHLNQLAGLSVNNDGISAVVGQIKTALEELQSLSGLLELDIQVKLTSKFKTSVDTVVKQINNGKKRIDDAMKKIPSAITKHISVTITASVNTRQAVAAITRGASYVEAIARQNRHRTINDAKGGLIYRAKGGSVPWKRRGTDTVPAMLTPGEYVHNKRAVSTFGIDFMRKVNNLDVKGAMNELMHRAGNMANVNRGTTINNYNNNQKVVINNNGNPGAGFTFKSASRFVGAI